MTDEKRFSIDGLLRVNVEVDARDITAAWTDTSEIVVRGPNVDASIQAGELFVTSEVGRRNNPGPIEIDLPIEPIGSEFKVERGQAHLSNPQGKVEVKVDSGDVDIQDGSGSLVVAAGRGDGKIEGFSGEVTLNNGSGDCTLVDITGPVTIRSGKGDVYLSGGQGQTVIAAASGDIRLRNRDCSEFTVAGASGDVSVTGGEMGRGTISTASGDIRCHAILTTASYDFNASSGDISVSIPRDLPARVDAATTRGNVTSELPLVAINQRGPRNPRGKRLVGSTSEAAERAELTLRTSSGDIDVSWGSNSTPSANRVEVRRPDRPSTAGSPPTAPEAPTDPADPPPSPEAAPNSVTEPGTESSTTDDDRRRAILSALSDGAISVEEAGLLLDALNHSTANSKGA
jgi:hypothetical protein